MTTITRHALVEHSVNQMFDLVNDVASYPQFLPWCSQAQVISATEHQIVARLEIEKGGLQKNFTTRNTLHRFERIDMELVEGPFKHLSGYWYFQELDDRACKVSLHLEFEFANFLLEKTLGALFSSIANTLLDAFVKRADELYA